MNRADKLSELIGDFVFHDRRIADQPSFRISVFLANGEILRRVATSGDPPVRFPDFTFRIGVERMSYVLYAMQEVGDDGYRSVKLYPIVVSGRLVGGLSLDSRTQLELSSTESSRVHVLSALVGYEIFHLQRRVRGPSRLSEDLGRVLRSAREELKLTQDDLAALVGISRITLSRWEAGAQSASRGPLRRWAAALGLLAGGRGKIINKGLGSHLKY